MTYRRDIQILRGLSIVLVLFFHLETRGAENGFLGVDIFFVISGFLMALLYRDGDIAGFIARRAKRLLPAYFATIVATVLAAAWLTLPAEFSAVGSQTVFATFLASNFGYWLADSYFDKTVFKPLLHLWSLGIEFQFFMILPGLYWLHQRWKLALPVLFVISLAGCLLAIGISSKSAFFLLPFRLWEFLAGGFAAALLTNSGALRFTRHSWVGLIGLLTLLAIPLMNVEGDAKSIVYGHPGLIAILVCAATVLVLGFGLPKAIESSWIGRIFEVLGKYSYSIYLVHFPIIVMHLYQPFSGTILGTGGALDALAMLLMTVSLSVAMYHLIEKPARNSTWNFQTTMAMPCLALLVMATGFGGTAHGLQPDRNADLQRDKR